MKCPHCHEETIPDGAQLGASALFPAKCSSCSGLSGVNFRFYGSYFAVLGSIALVFMLVAGDAQPMLYILLPIWFFYSLAWGAATGITALSASDVTTARVVTTIVFVITLILIPLILWRRSAGYL